MTFDFSDNPFVALGLDASADTREISEAIQDAIDDGVVSEDRAVRIRQVLTTPKLRLDAELASLPGVDRRLAGEIRSLLGRAQGAAELASHVERLHPLPRSNLLAHMNGRFGADHASLRQLLDAQEGCAAEEMTEALNEVRGRSGFPLVSRPAVEAGLRDLFMRQLQGAVDGFGDVGRLADEVGTLTSGLVGEARTPPEQLVVLLAIFGQAIEAKLSRRREGIRSACLAIGSQARDEEAYGRLAEALSDGLRLTAPLQVIEAAKGRDDPRTREMYEMVNDLGLWLANERDDEVAALKILRLARTAFVRLPRAAAEIEANVATVGGRIVWSRLGPLRSFVETVTDDARGLNADLLEGGFGVRSLGVARELFALFEAADRTFRGTDIHAQPWLAVHNLAITLANDFRFPAGALKLLDGLRTYSLTKPAPPGLAERIDAELSAVGDQATVEVIAAHVAAGRLRAAQKACEAGMAATRIDDNREVFSELRAGLRRRRRVKALLQLGCLIFGFCAVTFLMSNKQRSAPPGPAPSSSHAPASAGGAKRAAMSEAAPAGGGGVRIPAWDDNRA